MLKNRYLKRLLAWCPKETLRRPNIFQSVRQPHRRAIEDVILGLTCISVIAIAGIVVYLYTLPSFSIEIDPEGVGDRNIGGVHFPALWVHAYRSETYKIKIASRYGFDSPVALSIVVTEYKNGSEVEIYKEPKELPQCISATFNPNPVTVPANGQIYVNFTITVNADIKQDRSQIPRWLLSIKGESEKRQSKISLQLTGEPRIKTTREKLEEKVIEFLKTTDVAQEFGDNIIISEIYDHAPGGTVLVVKYETTKAGHPEFSMEAIESHTALITLNTRGEVTSAFCIEGGYHEKDKIWDLVNRKWIPSETLSTQIMR